MSLRFCPQHREFYGRSCSGCDRDEQRRANWPDDEGEALPPAPPERERICEVCLRPSLTNWCHSCEASDGDRFERLFGSSV